MTLMLGSWGRCEIVEQRRRENTHDTGGGDVEVDGGVLLDVSDIELLDEDAFWG